MTYTQYVSELNHKISRYGLSWIVTNVDVWFSSETDEMLAYSIALIEYCVNRTGLRYPKKYEHLKNFKLSEVKYPEHVEILIKLFGQSFADKFWRESITEFARHNLCVLEVGNAV